jgi:hypothetical protein
MIPRRLPRNAHLWLPGYLRSVRRRRRQTGHRPLLHVFFCLADHFEPAHGNPGITVERERVRAWTEGLPRLAARHRDADGRPPQHTFFFPAEEYRAEHLDALADLCRAGLGEVEIHLHHDRDTRDGLVDKLSIFKAQLLQHGLLGRDRQQNSVKYGFIHGNWALDNSRLDGRWCGVNDELTVLSETGCYADFTLPSAPSDTQTRTVNSIYYAIDDPKRPRSHEFGLQASVGHPTRDGLLMIQGPLALDWSRPKLGVLPRLENAELSRANPPTLERFRHWMRAGVGVEGRPEWVFVKVHTHGATERNAATLLGARMDDFHAALRRSFDDGQHGQLHYVTAREMANLVRAAEQGYEGPPHLFLDNWLVPPDVRRGTAVASPALASVARGSGQGTDARTLELRG